MTAPTSPVLEVDDLVTWFPTSNGVVRAVDGVSFTLQRGKTLGLVGESGSGKSVLGRSIMGLLPPHAITTRGRVLVDGRDVRAMSREESRKLWGKDVAMVFQDPMTSLNPVVRVGRHITESLQFHLGMNDREAKERAIALLNDVGITEPRARFRSYPHEMSGGMRQRVNIAIALACSPRILIADEPTTALDVTIQRQVLDLLSGFQRDRDMAMILVTHDLGVVASRADEILVMYGGCVMEKGPTRAIFRATKHPYTAALLNSIPRMERPSHTRLATIPGRPQQALDQLGCRFATRCRLAQPRCVAEAPPMEHTGDSAHQYACFYPIDTPAGDEALARNLAAGKTAAGRTIVSAEVA